MLQERLKQFCSELPGLKIIDSGAVSHVQLSGTLPRTKGKRVCRHAHAASQGESLMSAEVQRIGFGGGCHWCTEAVFAALRGVIRVEQGFIRADAPDDNFSEAVLLSFQPDKISLGP